MDKLLLNSFNKKILLLITFIVLVGFTANTFQTDIKDHYQKGGYTHKAEINPKDTLIQKDLTSQNTDVNLYFLPIHELEQVLKDYQYEQLYVNTDSNFDKKVQNIKTYMSRRNSPLSEKADYIVIMANKFNIDYRLLPAISIIESSGGTKLYRPYNAWGWGGSKGFTFENWEHSIYVVSNGLGRYYARGAVTPEQIAPAYNPHTPNEWSAKVKMVMNQIGSHL